MDAEGVRRRIDAIIEQQDAAMDDLRDASAAFDMALSGVRTGLDGMRVANEAQGAVISRLGLANREALQILRSMPQ